MFYVTVEKAHEQLNKNATNIKEEITPSISNIKQEDENSVSTEIEIDNVKNSVEFHLLSNTKNPLEECLDYDKEDECENYCYSDDGTASQISDESFEPEQKKKKCVQIKNKTSKSSAATKSSKRIEASTKKRMSHRLDPKTSEEVIKKHIQMACNLCLYVGNTFADIVDHFKDNHENIKPFIRCCDKKLTRGYCIAQHAYLHENPNSFRYINLLRFKFF